MHVDEEEREGSGDKPTDIILVGIVLIVCAQCVSGVTCMLLF